MIPDGPLGIPANQNLHHLTASEVTKTQATPDFSFTRFVARMQAAMPHIVNDYGEGGHLHPSDQFAPFHTGA